MQWQERGPDRLGYTERDFKVCGFCSALNPATNIECFVCGWTGQFHTDRETVYEAMRALEEQYGELDRSLFAEEVLPSIAPRPSIWSDVWGSIRRLFGRA